MDNLFIVNGNELELMIINTLPYTVLVLVSQLELTFIKVACSEYFFSHQFAHFNCKCLYHSDNHVQLCPREKKHSIL